MIAQRIASRFGFKTAMKGWNPFIPDWVVKWSERTSFKVAYYSERDQGIFQTSKDSINTLLPKFLDALHKAYRDRFHMNASQSGTSIYYFFSPKNPIETFALHLMVRGGKAHLALGYMPHGVTSGHPDYSKVVEERVVIDDPEVAGLAFMRMARKLLSRVS